MKIHVSIERLILDGLPVDQDSAPLIREAVQNELSRLFAENPAQYFPAGGALASLRTAPIQIGSPSPPEVVGHEIARAMHGGLNR